MSATQKKVLFVDDSVEFLDVTQQIMSTIAGPQWEVHSAQNVGQAMNLIDEKQIDLVVLDVHMPVVDGMQFLSLLSRKHPNVLKAVLTGDTSEVNRTMCLSRGAELFLAKPHEETEWLPLFNCLNEIGRFQPQEGFRGVLRRVGLQDVLQMECLSRNSALLEITTKELRGRVYIFEGQIIHAEAGERTGTEAFNYLMGLTGGEFAQKPFVMPARRTISDSWEFLLMEAARRNDEAGGDDTEVSEPPRPTELREMEPIPEFETEPAPIIRPSARPAPPPPRPAATPRPAPPPPPPEAQTQFFVRPPAANAVDRQRPEVAEFLIFSSQGDLLYEWQCHDVNARVNFLEFLSQKARLLCQGLPMGHFERFEVFGTKSRIITQLENDHAIFVRSNVVVDHPVPGDNG